MARRTTSTFSSGIACAVSLGEPRDQEISVAAAPTLPKRTKAAENRRPRPFPRSSSERGTTRIPAPPCVHASREGKRGGSRSPVAFHGPTQGTRLRLGRPINRFPRFVLPNPTGLSAQTTSGSQRRQRPLGVVPHHVVHPGLLGGWGCLSHPVPRRTPNEAPR